MYGTSTISALFQKEFLDSKSLQNRIENQIGNSKLKTENRKEIKTEKREENLPGPKPTEPAQLPISPVLVPVRYMTSGTHQGESSSSTSGSKKQLAVVVPSLGRAKIRAAAL
jgi:hypothetical protein